MDIPAPALSTPPTITTEIAAGRVSVTITASGPIEDAERLAGAAAAAFRAFGFQAVLLPASAETDP